MAKEHDQKVKELLQSYVDKGYQRPAIEKVFDKAGYDDTLVKETLDQIELREHNQHLWKHMVAIMLCVLVPMLLTFAITSIILNAGTDCGADMTCFAEAARACEKADGHFMLEESRVDLQTDDCMLTKEITRFDPTEPIEIVSMLEDKQMTCTFTEETFDEELLTLSGRLDLCEGELKDAMLALQLSYLQLS
jgi:hypothetical protein